MQHIRNFSIIAHVDHGKSTLADRIIQLCGGLEAREMEAQVLDSNPIERERGITIKAQSVSLPYRAQDGNTYQLNFIDTPGHVDFSYEVSRSLAACEGALLVVDAAQGVEAQSVANCYTAVEQGLEVVPVLNKIDLPTADVERVKREIEAVIGVDEEHGGLARLERAGHFIGEVDVPGRVDHVQLVGLAVAGLVAQRHALRLDRYAALALQRHRVEHLGLHLACLETAAELDEAVG